jgi:hypothetical protein
VGLGDAVERIAKPIARKIDEVTADLLGTRGATRLAGCSACSRRRKWLNAVLRDARAWRGWATALRRIVPAWRAVYGVRRP